MKQLHVLVLLETCNQNFLFFNLTVCKRKLFVFIRAFKRLNWITNFLSWNFNCSYESIVVFSCWVILGLWGLRFQYEIFYHRGEKSKFNISCVKEVSGNISLLNLGLYFLCLKYCLYKFAISFFHVCMIYLIKKKQMTLLKPCLKAAAMTAAQRTIPVSYF